ncbi:plastid division protein PDV2 [Raphanus sativus]|uniref:Plastid division protein PDV2 n=1 Tax=Raphanus sativus TaxID=3726 RepID=A0A6J0JE13_RAPSA|nr:plastid division protein PDV2 [Raphanus sativus]
MEDEEGIGLILARATELRLKINDCIETSSTDVSSPREGKKDEITGLQEKDFDSFSSDDVDDEEESGEQLLCIRDALESLESQLAALQNLRQRQQYEKQVALSEIDYSRKMLLEKLKEYKGKELEVLSEASTFAGERVDYENDLLLPPYPVHPPLPLSLGLDNNNAYLPYLPSKQKKSADANGFGSAEVKGPSGVVRFFGSVAKIMLPIIGVISVLAASGYGPEIKKRGVSFKLLGLLPQRVVRAPNQCPPGKVLVIEDGEARCLVKERVEIPFDSVVAKRDVTYGYG